MALLDDELQVTARLRVENPSVSLSELAALHNPPITKSGVNSRLTKILLVAEELKDK
jgi:DNA-binding protein WhiA